MHSNFTTLLGVDVFFSETEVVEGEFTYDGRLIHVKDGVPIFVSEDLNDEQKKTNITFSAKWNRYMRGGDEALKNEMLDFVLRRINPGKRTEASEFIDFLSKKRMILDAGSGNGWMSQYMALHTNATVISAEIGDGVYAAYEKCKNISNCHVIKADLMDLPFENNTFDFIYSDGVLHHTPNTKNAMKELYDKLASGGVFWFYIYKEMNPVKHFCDDYIRNMFGKMSPDEALKNCEAITDLGRELSKVKATIKLEKPIDVLNIPAGEYDVQRFIYYNFIKCFWNEAIGYENSNIVNFDWYHPNNAQQQTVDEVESWMKEFDIKKYEIWSVNPNGMNVRIVKE